MQKICNQSVTFDMLRFVKKNLIDKSDIFLKSIFFVWDESSGKALVIHGGLI